MTRRTIAVGAVLLAGGAMVVAAGRWAIAPVDPLAPVAPRLAAVVPDASDDPAEADPRWSIDPAAFAANFWNTEPELVAGEAAATTPSATVLATPELALRPAIALLAITRDATGFAASLYDAAADAVVTARPGGTVGDVRVTSVSAGRVELAAGADRWTLALDDADRDASALAEVAAAASKRAQTRGTIRSARSAGGGPAPRRTP